jgi:hypothetical protein
VQPRGTADPEPFRSSVYARENLRIEVERDLGRSRVIVMQRERGCAGAIGATFLVGLGAAKQSSAVRLPTAASSPERHLVTSDNWSSLTAGPGSRPSRAG